MSKARKRLDVLKAGGIPQVTPHDLWAGTPVGDVPDVEERAVLGLARAIHHAESTDCSISWSAQERALAFYNERGLGDTLDEMFRLEGEKK